MKTAIIGASGFIGTRAVEMFHLSHGPSVVAITRHPARLVRPARFAVELRVADATDETSLAKALEGCAAAVHVIQGESRDLKRLATTFCRAAARAGVRRLVYLSSAAVHGQNPSPGTSEDTPPPRGTGDKAAAAQLAAERQFFSDCRDSGITGYALRPGVVFGPRSPLFANIAEELRDGRAWLVRNGESIFQSTYVDNLVAAVRLCLKAKNHGDHAYIVGDAETVTWRDFYHAIARDLELSASRIHYVAPIESEEAIGRQVRGGRFMPPPGSGTVERAALQNATAKLPFSAAARKLGYTPEVAFAEAVRRSCAWWRFAEGETSA